MRRPVIRAVVVGAATAAVGVAALLVLDLPAVGDPLFVLSVAVVAVVGFVSGVAAAVTATLTLRSWPWSSVYGGLVGGVVAAVLAVLVVIPAPALVGVAVVVVTGLACWVVTRKS